MSWSDEAPELASLEKQALEALNALHPMEVPAGTILFRPGDAVKGYVIVLSGRVNVHLVGPNARDILLYAVVPGQSCVQSTLGLLGGGDYTGEAVAETPTRLVLLPRDAFLSLVDSSRGFRNLVFAAFAERMQSMMHLIENVSFMRVESRLAALILDRADATGCLNMTQADIATAIGTAREVVSRRIEKLEKAGCLTHERAAITITDRGALSKLAQGAAM